MKVEKTVGVKEVVTKAEMTYAADVESFLKKVQEAHKQAATSELVFA